MFCSKCPRHCDAERRFCNADSSSPEVASVYAHTGEEPPISGRKGISNIFFAHCNLQCLFCQNHQISRTIVDPKTIALHSVDEIVEATAKSLTVTENMVGLVSATQYSDLVAPIVDGLHQRGLYPTVVYNSNGYEEEEVLQQIAPYIDVWLPDFKYSSSDLALRYSHAANYPNIAGKALKMMFDMVGTSLPTDDDGLAFRGMIVRHLVLPGQVQNSIDCLQWLAENLSTNLHISLMSQYYPPSGIDLPDQLNRTLTEDEYSQVVDAFYSLGFHRGWVQQLDSQASYRPDFADSNNVSFGRNSE